MKSTTIYFLFTDTGTTLSRIINFFTRRSLNHVSISFDESLSNVYSFGRKRPRNPFIGGFVREDIRGDFLRDSNCAVFTFKLTTAECEKVISNIKKIEADKKLYKYNFIGLLGVLFQIEINRKHAYFCSQFVARVMSDIDSFKIDKPHCFVTPEDIRNHKGMHLIYKGKLGNYQHEESGIEHKLVSASHFKPKKSFILFISEKVKRLVVR